jgi:choline dehydrogenase
MVNDQRRVRGSASLRNVDAGEMPTPVSGLANKPVMTIAEKASDLIFAVATDRRA